MGGVPLLEKQNVQKPGSYLMHDFRCVRESSGKANGIAHTHLPARLTNNLRIKGNLAIASRHARPKISLSIRFPSQAVKCLAVSHTVINTRTKHTRSRVRFPAKLCTLYHDSCHEMHETFLLLFLKKKERERLISKIRT